MMISIQEMQDILANGFFGGNTTIAGLIMFSLVLLLMFTLVRETKTVIILSLPVTLIFATLGILSTDMMILLIIVAVLVLAMSARNLWERGGGA